VALTGERPQELTSGLPLRSARRDRTTARLRPTSQDLKFEVLVEADGPVIVAQRVGKEGKGQAEPVRSPYPQWLNRSSRNDSGWQVWPSQTVTTAGPARHQFAPVQRCRDRTVERRVGDGVLRYGRQIRSPQVSLRRARLLLFRLRVSVAGAVEDFLTAPFAAVALQQKSMLHRTSNGPSH
jgi:hypothetical protein